LAVMTGDQSHDGHLRGRRERVRSRVPVVCKGGIWFAAPDPLFFQRGAHSKRRVLAGCARTVFGDVRQYFRELTGPLPFGPPEDSGRIGWRRSFDLC
jgi:hypothetical protein